MPPLDQTGGIYQNAPRVVVVSQIRGARGLPGDAGDIGPQGESFTMRGGWVSGTVYAPLDAVTYRSSALAGVTSLYIQKNSVEEAISTTVPYLDPTRWEEIGSTDIRNAFGGIWQVHQIAHGFTKVGQPVGYSLASDIYVQADARTGNELAIGVVREVVSPDIVVLQSTGEVPGIDVTVILPDGSDWMPGRIYYATATRGRLSLDPPQDPNYFVNPVLLAASHVPATGRSGVVLPWTPVGGTLSRTARQVVGFTKYHFTISSPTSAISGDDNNSQTLAYNVADGVEVFLNGLNLIETAQYSATDGTSIDFVSALSAADEVEVWVYADATIPTYPATASKVDSIESQFDGVETVFDLKVGGVKAHMQDTLSLRLWLDASPQEPLVDYNVIEDPGQPGFAQIEFAEAPEPATRFWAMLIRENAATVNLKRIVVIDDPGEATDDDDIIYVIYQT